MGNCYAKRYLLAALLRANGFPARLCYQRLIIENQEPPFCLHILHAIFLDKYGWYSVDARGNTALGEIGSPIICIPRSSFLPDAVENSMPPRSFQLPMSLELAHLNFCAILS
ncbi:MAG: transglutaminase family protein [Nitrospirota bacterium]